MLEWQSATQTLHSSYLQHGYSYAALLPFHLSCQSTLVNQVVKSHKRGLWLDAKRLGEWQKEMNMHGDCICGEVAFEIDGALPKAYQCHCSICRKQGGSSSNTGLIIAKKNFRWLKGEDKVSSFIKDTGFRSDFCAKCGAVVPNPFRDQPFVWVPAGALNGNVSLDIAAHICVGSKAAWDSIDSNVKQYETMPTLTELIDLMHADV